MDQPSRADKDVTHAPGFASACNISPMRILLLEDDTTLGYALHEFLSEAGYAVDWLTGGAQALPTLAAQSYGLVLLDLNLPDVGGMEILQRLRASGATVPVLILTARDAVDARVAGLDAGADDYVVKPFAPQELAARVRVFQRRSKDAHQITVGTLLLDATNRELSVDGKRMPLSVRELSVLEMLMARAGHVVTKQQIVANLSASDADFSENAVEVYVYRLRKHLEHTNVGIQTVRGFGYLLDVG